MGVSRLPGATERKEMNQKRREVDVKPFGGPDLVPLLFSFPVLSDHYWVSQVRLQRVSRGNTREGYCGTDSGRRRSTSEPRGRTTHEDCRGSRRFGKRQVKVEGRYAGRWRSSGKPTLDVGGYDPRSVDTSGCRPGAFGR